MREIIIKYWIEAGFTLLVSVLGLYIRQKMKMVKEYLDSIQSDREEQSVIKNALLSILRDRLFTECRRILDKGYIQVEEVDNLTCMYTEYHDGFHANGSIEELYKRCLSLPIK